MRFIKREHADITLQHIADIKHFLRNYMPLYILAGLVNWPTLTLIPQKPIFGMFLMQAVLLVLIEEFAEKSIFIQDKFSLNILAVPEVLCFSKFVSIEDIWFLVVSASRYSCTWFFFCWKIHLRKW